MGIASPLLSIAEYQIALHRIVMRPAKLRKLPLLPGKDAQCMHRESLSDAPEERPGWSAATQ
jgi:hypothetical protein